MRAPPFEELPLPTFYAVDERLAWVSRQAAELLGEAPEALVGRRIFDFVEPPDRPKVEGNYWARQGGERNPQAYEARVRRKDGTLVLVEISSRNVGPREQLAVVRDVSHRLRGGALVSALSEIALALQRTRTVQGVLERAGEGLSALGLSLTIARRAGDELVLDYVDPGAPALGPIEQHLGRPLLGLRIPLARVPVARQALEQLRSIFLDDLFPPVVEALGALPPELLNQAGLLAPLFVQGQPWGLGCLCGRGLTSEDGATLSLFAAQLASSIEVAETIESLERRRHELSLINELGALVSQHLDLSEVLALGVRNLARIADAPHVDLVLGVPGTRLLRSRATNVPDLKPKTIELSLDEPSLVGAAVLGREPVVVDDAASDPRCAPALVRRFGYKTAMAVPLIARGEAIGAVFLGEFRAERRFTPADVERVLAATNPLAAAIANARLYEDARKSYESLAQTQAELVKRERLAALGELAAVVAHEVRNPLAVIFNSLGSIKKLKAVEPDAAMLLGIVGEEADRLNRMVGDLLDFARPHEPSVQPESLESVLSGALEAATSAVNRDAVELELHVPRDLPPVPVDARLLRQAFVNLVVNALQATAKGGRVRLEARSEREGERTLARVDVIDTGPGIPAALTDQIFQPFFTTKATGTGLGLAVVKRIVEAHRGQIAFSSQPGRGTTFTIRLPVS